ncbi:MAG: Uma2 family endonuclease [Bacteroidia bacterium]|nr:Uma2 family endonuclease [Bacteroidia bacterium]
MESITLDIPQARTWSHDQLYEFCMANPTLAIERDAQGIIHIMSPAGGLSSIYSGQLFFAVESWNRQSGLGKTFDSSGGFLLPGGAMLAPDVAWVQLETWNSLTKKDKEQFPPICPDFIIEVKSRTDRLNTLKQKMATWMENGCSLGWLIDPTEQKAYVYSQGSSIEREVSFESELTGKDLMPGFRYLLSDLFA